ncbi:hypothetical protein EV191_103128 [Tamaricihabitans halophyticus]|uniref:CopC domain-containing protein n=1 Tax=Tamaricihabitans halophyticus TaxID=1262583 RepID=A0A4R2QWK5_9PSEU|nr:copper resistance CopC family protein [Tamaricihabitans halophyticus]TCP54087.1 hypothetical protein EV191_103128 [Tamaricihabitans halophyticus]
MRRALVLAMLTGLALLGSAGPALAHNQLIESDPADGATVQSSPAEVTLTFDQPVQPGDFNQIAVTGPDGDSWVDGTATVDSNKVSARVLSLGPAGEYTIGYRILSADGHPVEGQTRFELTKAGTGTPAPSAPQQAPADSPDAQPAGEGDTEESGGVPLWVWIGGAVLLLGAGLFFALRGGRSSND